MSQSSHERADQSCSATDGAGAVGGVGGGGSIAVIGGGIAGLAAARTLAEAGLHAVVFDKGRGPGGRSSSRYAAPYSFDHGAQYFTARDASFRRVLDAWLAEGIAARWDGRIVALRERETSPLRGTTERFVGAPRMSALAQALARGIALRSATRVTSLERHGRAWRLIGGDAGVLGEFERLVVAMPPAQAVALIGELSPLGDRVAALAMRPCWAALLGVAEPYLVEFDGAFCEGSALSWVCRNNSKPGRPAAEAWVLHASPEWSEAHLDDDPRLVGEALARELERLTAVPLPRLLHSDTQRWRLALPASELETGVLHDRKRGLVLAGDAYHGGRIEGAYLSGVAAARCLAEARATDA
jgi:predicted NAD/FAD-dependent oxidoreductase